MINICTERLIIKPISESDRAEMLEILFDDEVKQTYMIPDFQSAEEAERTFQIFVRLSSLPDRFVVGVFLDGVLIGFFNDVERDGRTVELGYVISPKNKNNGYCTEALGAVIKYLLSERFDEVICGAFSENEASIRVMQKCSMSLLDKTEIIEYRGRSHSCVYYSIKKN